MKISILASEPVTWRIKDEKTGQEKTGATPHIVFGKYTDSGDCVKLLTAKASAAFASWCSDHIGEMISGDIAYDNYGKAVAVYEKD